MKKATSMAKESFSITQARYMKASFPRIWRMERGYKYTQMDQGLKANLWMVSNKAGACSNGATEKYMMGSGRTVRKMEVECGKGLTVNHI